MTNLRFVYAAVVLTTLVWLIHSLTFKSEASLSPIDLAQIVVDTATELVAPGKLQSHGLQDLSSVTELSTLLFHAVPHLSEAPLIQELDIRLPQFEIWSKEDTKHGQPFAATSVEVASNTSKADVSSIIFGLATNLQRLDKSLESFAYWASNSNTTIVAVVPFEEEAPLEEAAEELLVLSHMKHHHGYNPRALSVSSIIQKARSLSVNLIIHQRPEDYAHRVVSLLEILHAEAQSLSAFYNIEIEWASIIDDDTFFPSTSRLLDLLSNHNSSLPQYVGGLSEDLSAIASGGYYAYGGAGIFLSLPLLVQLEPYFDTCLLPSNLTSGDGRIAECIYKYSTTKLSVEESLNQLDLNGDYSGIYEAIRPLPISLHHWKSWDHHNMALTSAITTLTGQESIMQKYHLANGWWMTHGYSIVRYSDEWNDADEDFAAFAASNHTKNPPKSPVDPEYIHPVPQLSHRAGAMEQTFELPTDEGINAIDNKRYLHSLSPLRPKDEGKQQYLIESAVRENNRTMTLYYVRRVEGVAQGVIRVIWTK